MAFHHLSCARCRFGAVSEGSSLLIQRPRKVKEDGESTGCNTGPALHGSLVPSPPYSICLLSHLWWCLCWQVDGNLCTLRSNPGQHDWLISQWSSSSHTHERQLLMDPLSTIISPEPGCHYLNMPEAWFCLCCTYLNTLRSPRLFSGINEQIICFQGFFSQARRWKMTISFCFMSPVSVYYFCWPKHWSSPL